MLFVIKKLFLVVAVATATGLSSNEHSPPALRGVMGFVPSTQHQTQTRLTASTEKTIRLIRGGSDATYQTQLDAHLAQYSGAVSSLFGNMITPASILGGAIIPIAFASGLDYVGSKDETKFAQFLRKVFPLVAVASLLSMLISVLWSSVTVNQLTENIPEKAASVWDLLQRDFALEWAGVNSHFVLGMLGYMWLIATKAFFMGGGAPVFAIAMSGMLSMVSIINRGVARGGGSSVHRYGSSIVGLLQTYVTLLFKRSCENFGPVEVLAFGVFAVSLCVYGRTVWTKVQSNAD